MKNKLTIEEQIKKHKIAVFKASETEYRLRYDYQDKGYNFCSIWITVPEITQEVITKLIKKK